MCLPSDMSHHIFTYINKLHFPIYLHTCKYVFILYCLNFFYMCINKSTFPRYELITNPFIFADICIYANVPLTCMTHHIFAYMNKLPLLYICIYANIPFSYMFLSFICI